MICAEFRFGKHLKVVLGGRYGRAIGLQQMVELGCTEHVAGAMYQRHGRFDHISRMWTSFDRCRI